MDVRAKIREAGIVRALSAKSERLMEGLVNFRILRVAHRLIKLSLCAIST